MICLLVAGGLYLRLSSGPMSIGFAKAPFERILRSSLGTADVRIRDVIIEKAESGSIFEFRLRELELLGKDGEVLARAPRAAIGIRSGSILSGDIVPSRLELIGPRIKLSRDKNGGVSLGFLEQETAGKSDRETSASASRIVDLLLETFARTSGNDGGVSNLDQIDIRNAKISLLDDQSNELWVSPRSDLIFRKVIGGVALAGNMVVSTGRQQWQAALDAEYIEADRIFRMDARVKDFVPAEIAGKLSVLSNFAQMRLPLSGRVILTASREGKLLGAEAQFVAGAGHVGFPEFLTEPVLVDEGEVRVGYAPDTGQIVLRDAKFFIGGNQARVTGAFTPVLEDNLLQRLDFDLKAQSVSIDTQGTVTDAVPIDSVTFAGSVDAVERRLNVSEIGIVAGDTRVALSGTVTEREGGADIALSGDVREMPFSLLRRLWPQDVADGARKWLVENIVKGDITSAKLHIDLKAEDIENADNDLPIPQDNIDISFTFANVESRYLGELPVIRGGTGKARLRGDDFVLDVDKGYVTVGKHGRIEIESGQFSIPSIHPKGPMSHVKAKLAGKAANALRVMDYKPLEYMKKFGLDPATVGGDAVVDLSMNIPLLKELPLDLIGLDARARVAKVSLPKVFGEAGITGGDLDLRASTKNLKAKGKVEINGVSTDLVWDEDFEPSGGESSRFTINTTLTDKERASLGIDLSDLVKGPVKVELVAYGKGPDIKRADLRADLSSADLFFRPIGWYRSKSKGVAADLKLAFAENRIKLHDIDLSGRNLLVKGEVVIDETGKLISLDLPEVDLGRTTRLALSGKRGKSDALDVQLKAAEFDARPVLRKALRSGGENSGGGGSGGGKARRDGVNVKGTIARAHAYNGETIDGVTVSLSTRGDVVTELLLDGKLANGRPVKAQINRAKNGYRRLRVDGGDAGRVLRSADLYSKVDGGDFRLLMNMPASSASGDRRGELKLKRFTVRNESALREFGSEKVGTKIRKSKRGGDFYFDSLTIPFRTRGHIMEIDNALLKGAAIGASAQGIINTRQDTLNIGGTLIPAYALNSFVSHVPLIGDILTGGKGQGVFGLTFAVRGKVESPRVQINPVSALVPGIFRKAFEFGGDSLDDDDAPKRRNRPVSDR